jgi:hypothetical protein
MTSEPVTVRLLFASKPVWEALPAVRAGYLAVRAISPVSLRYWPMPARGNAEGAESATGRYRQGGAMTDHERDVGAVRPFPVTLDVDRWLLDRPLHDMDGVASGKIDDLEFSDPVAGQAPELVAVLRGPAAVGPRIGGRLGVWWTAIGLRLQTGRERDLVSIPVGVVAGIRHAAVQLRSHRQALGTEVIADRVREKIAHRTPGSG